VAGIPAMTEVEFETEPNGIANDIRWELYQTLHLFTQLIDDPKYTELGLICGNSSRFGREHNPTDRLFSLGLDEC